MGPDLAVEGSRVRRAWLERFLRAPTAIRPAGYEPLSPGRMPDFALTPEEATDLAAYLMTRRGPALGREPAPPAPETLARGRELFRQYACRACHVREGAGGRAGPDLSAVGERLTFEWLVRIIQDPQALDPRSPMPNLGVSEADARAIAWYLSDGVPAGPDPPPDPAAAARGEALFRGLGCPGCHPGDPAAPRVGPSLTDAGDRFRREWLAAFLARPGRVRPGRLARMPDFRLRADEVRTLVEFLAAQRDPHAPPLPEPLRAPVTPTPARVEAGRRLASQEFLSCDSCHVAEAPPGGRAEEWAPDLALAGRRLQPEWIVRWLLDPQRLSPGTAMPSYFPDATSGPEEVLGGDEFQQILALRDYILALGGAPAPSADREPE